jgi:photosystem II stability/assembly factor-like uncharacterized protein
MVAVVNVGDIYRSSDYGATWTPTANGSLNSLSWQSVASNSDGSKMVAVVINGDIYRSSDYGATWTPTGDTHFNTNSWQSVASNSDGSKMVAVVYGGDIYRSNDYGATWNATGDTNLNSLSWISVASNSDGSKMVAVVYGGDIYRSSDYGATWTPTGNYGLNSLSWISVASNSDGSKMVAVVNGGDIYLSNDYGATWTSNGNGSLKSLSWTSVASNSDGSKLVAVVNGGDIYRSNDYGATWTPTGDTNLNTKNWQSVASNSNGNILVAVVRDILAPGYIYVYNMNTQMLCFKEDTKIFCLVDNKETYLPIQDLQRGTLVKTRSSGYKAVELIGSKKMYNPGNKLKCKNRLYKCTNEKYPEIIEDLYITGCHSILVEEITYKEREELIESHGRIFLTEDRYRLVAYLDERAEPYEEEGLFNIWHFALENEDYYMNYGVYANGLLVESSSLRMMSEYSGMELI